MYCAAVKKSGSRSENSAKPIARKRTSNVSEDLRKIELEGLDLEGKRTPHWSKYSEGSRGVNIPKGLLDAANVVQIPILLGYVLLTDGHTGPLYTQLSDTIDVVLVEINLERAEVALGPLGEAPLLNNLLGSVELDILAGDVAVKNGELAAGLGALELTGSTTGEGGNALRVGENFVELLSGGTELIGRGHGGSVNGNLAGGGGGSCGGGSSLLLAGLRVDGYRGESSGRVDTRGVLDVLGMLINQGIGELVQGLAELRDDLGANEVLDGSLGSGIGVVLNLELARRNKNSVSGKEGCSEDCRTIIVGVGSFFIRERTTYSSSSVSWATSGMEMEPLTSSSSLVLPMEQSQLPSLIAFLEKKNKSTNLNTLEDSLTSNKVMTLPLRWLTSTSPSMDNTLSTSDGHALFLGTDDTQVLLQVLLGPARGVLVHPVPVVGVVENHDELGELCGKKEKN